MDKGLKTWNFGLSSSFTMYQLCKIGQICYMTSILQSVEWR